MEVPVILITGIIVNFGLSCAQSRNKIGAKTLTGENQEIFRNLFESISKNDMENTGAYRNILEQRAVREQHAFNLMKEDAQFARHRNANKQKNGEKSAVFKRETQGRDKEPMCAAPTGKADEEIEIESFAQQVKDLIANMTDSYDRSTGENIHTMWYEKMLEIEKSLRTNTAPILKNEAATDDSQVEFFAQRVRRKIDNWPDVEQPVGTRIHLMWYEKARDIEKRLKKKYRRT